jgi:hypothetical protein
MNKLKLISWRKMYARKQRIVDEDISNRLNQIEPEHIKKNQITETIL